MPSRDCRSLSSKSYRMRYISEVPGYCLVSLGRSQSQPNNLQAVHVPIPALTVRISSALEEQWTSSSPCRHESKHDERVPEGVVILETAGGRRARLGQAKNLDKHDGVEDEKACPE